MNLSITRTGTLTKNAVIQGASSKQLYPPRSNEGEISLIRDCRKRSFDRRGLG